jgi:uncharacterized membrane protein
MEKKNFLGLSDNIAGLLCYALLYVTGLLFFLLEKENKSIRFHALQSLVWFGALAVGSFVIIAIVGGIPIIGALIRSLFSLVTIVSWVFLMYMAYKGNEFRIPVVGDAVWEQVNK